MSVYYQGDIDSDLESIADIPQRVALEQIGNAIGFGRARQIIQNIETYGADQLADGKTAEALERICSEIGSRRALEVLQILWARILRDLGVNTMGALGPTDGPPLKHPQ